MSAESKSVIDSANILPSHVMPRLPAGISKIVNLARVCAVQSTQPMRHGAVLFAQSGKQVFASSENTFGSKVCGYDVPGQHAEANCLQYIFHKASSHRRLQARLPRAKVYREKGSQLLWK